MYTLPKVVNGFSPGPPVFSQKGNLTGWVRINRLIMRKICKYKLLRIIDTCTVDLRYILDVIGH